MGILHKPDSFVQAAEHVVYKVKDKVEAVNYQDIQGNIKNSLAFTVLNELFIIAHMAEIS